MECRIQYLNLISPSIPLWLLWKNNECKIVEYSLPFLSDGAAPSSAKKRKRISMKDEVLSYLKTKKENGTRIKEKELEMNRLIWEEEKGERSCRDREKQNDEAYGNDVGPQSAKLSWELKKIPYTLSFCFSVLSCAVNKKT